MRLHSLIIHILVLVCLEMAGLAPASFDRPSPNSDSRPSPKVYPISLVYRAQLYHRIRLLAQGNDAALASVQAPPPPLRLDTAGNFRPLAAASLLLSTRLLE